MIDFQKHWGLSKSCYAIITGHRLIYKIKITTLRNLTSLSPLFDIVKSRCLKLYGHIKRSSLGLAKLCLEGIVPGKRKRGRPKGRWRDNILIWSASQNWSAINKLVLDRKKWRQISHVGSQSATGGNSGIWLKQIYSCFIFFQNCVCCALFVVKIPNPPISE